MKRAILTLLLGATSGAFAESRPPLNPGDSLALVFSIKEDPLDGVYTVAKDGTLNLPFIGRLSVAGKTSEETCHVIRQRYLQDGIYTRLAVTSIPVMRHNFLSIPSSDGQGRRRIFQPANHKPAQPTGDFHTPQEKMKLYQHPQLDVRNDRP